jgi:hypothetical protein
VLHRREVVRAVILAGANSSNLLELLDHKGVRLCSSAITLLACRRISENIPTELVKKASCHSSTEMTLNSWQTVEA